MQLVSNTLAKLAKPTGAELIGTIKQGIGAVPLPLSFLVQECNFFYPEQYGADPTGVADSTTAIQNCIDAAGEWDEQVEKVNVVWLSGMYRIGFVQWRPYVNIRGANMLKTGFIVDTGTDFGLVCVEGDGAGIQYAQSGNFCIDGEDATGSAGGLLLEGVKVAVLQRLILKNFLTTTPALALRGAVQTLTLEQFWLFNNHCHEEIIATDAANNLFPTTITHKQFAYEDSPVQDTYPAIRLVDANGCYWGQNTVAQSCGQKILFDVSCTDAFTTTGENVFDGIYLEGNGGVGVEAQAGALAFKLKGTAAKPLSNCTIKNLKAHGASPLGGWISLERTNRFTYSGNVLPSVAIVDAGNNTNYDIDATRSLGCALQTDRYSLSAIRFRDDNSVDYKTGVINAVPAKNNTGEYYINLGIQIKNVGGLWQGWCSAVASNASGECMATFAYFEDAGGGVTRIVVRTTAPDFDPGNVTFSPDTYTAPSFEEIPANMVTCTVTFAGQLDQ